MQELAEFAADFFAEEKPPRNPKNGNPLLIPRSSTTAERVEYSRMSSLADVFDDHFFLWKWKMRGLAMGLSQNLDLMRLLAAETYTVGFVDIPDIEGEGVRARAGRQRVAEAENRESGKRVDAVIERALDRVGIDIKADYGTAIHMRTEPTNDGVDPDDKQEQDVASCWELWSRIGAVHLGTEVFTANDEIRSAGTFDHLTYIPGIGIVITDKKTSSKAKMGYDVQLGGYAFADVYDPETDQRMTLEEYVASKGWNPALLRRDIGMIWWVKNGKTEARLLDLTAGYAAARVAAWIRDNREPINGRVAKNVTKDLIAGSDTLRAQLATAISNAESVEMLMTIWSDPAAQAIWNDEHTAAATARKEAL